MSIIPLPLQVVSGNGSFALPDTVVVRPDGPGSEAVCSYLVSHLQDQLDLDASAAADAGSAAVTLQCGPGCAQALEEVQLPQEAYELRVDDAGVHLAAAGPAGLFYAVQSLMQLLPAQPQEDIALQHIQVGLRCSLSLHVAVCRRQCILLHGGITVS